MSADQSPHYQSRYALTQENFDSLLRWLHPDRELAGKRYEEIRFRLIKLFVHRGCTVAEDLADETLNRVAGKLPEIEGNYVGEKERYFYAVAGNVHLEYVRKRPTPTPLPAPDPPEVLERNAQCLESCLKTLPTDHQQLILHYFMDEKQKKIENRKRLADQFGITLNSLRMRAHRIKSVLQECVLHCIEESKV